MKRFNQKGMIVIPNPLIDGKSVLEKSLVAVEACCPNGHSLIDSKAQFNGYPGIIVDVEQDKQKGKIAFSPVFGENARISLDIDLIPGKNLKMFCPVCSVQLPVHSKCDACDDGDLVTFFLNSKGDFSYCIGICNKVDCPKATLIESGELISLNMLQSL